VRHLGAAQVQPVHWHGLDRIPPIHSHGTPRLDWALTGAFYSPPRQNAATTIPTGSKSTTPSTSVTFQKGDLVNRTTLPVIEPKRTEFGFPQTECARWEGTRESASRECAGSSCTPDKSSGPWAWLSLAFCGLGCSATVAGPCFGA